MKERRGWLRAASRQEPTRRCLVREKRFALPVNPSHAHVSPFEDLCELEPIIAFRARSCLVPLPSTVVAPKEATPSPHQATTEDPGSLFRFEEERRSYRWQRYNRHYWPDAFVVMYLGFLILAGVLGFCLGK